jgi:hypothetical protein
MNVVTRFCYQPAHLDLYQYYKSDLGPGSAMHRSFLIYQDQAAIPNVDGRGRVWEYQPSQRKE